MSTLLTVGELIAAEAVRDNLGRSLDGVDPQATSLVVAGVSILVSRGLATRHDDGSASLNPAFARVVAGASLPPVIEIVRNDGVEPVESLRVHAVEDGAILLASRPPATLELDEYSSDEVPEVLQRLIEASAAMLIEHDESAKPIEVTASRTVDGGPPAITWPDDWDHPVAHAVFSPLTDDAVSWVVVQSRPWLLTPAQDGDRMLAQPITPDAVRYLVASVIAGLTAFATPGPPPEPE